MGTLGLVTVVSTSDIVLMKIIVGSDGRQAKKFAEQLKKEWPVTKERAFEMAVSNNFGSEESDLVVMDSGGLIFKGDDNINSLYYETFNKVEFNPRWKIGISDFTEIIKVPDP